MLAICARAAAMLVTSLASAAAHGQADPSLPYAPTPHAALPSGDSATLKARLTAWDKGGALAESEVSDDEPLRLNRPLETGLLTSSFGVRSDPMTGTVRVHRGLDIAAPHGTPIYASEDGVVSYAAIAGGYGQLIQIDHGNSIQTRYGHLSRILVRSGESIRRGETIGFVGSTGRSTGSHLHFEVRINGMAVDPSRPVRSLPIDLPAPASSVVEPVIVHWQGWKKASDRLPSSF